MPSKEQLRERYENLQKILIEYQDTFYRCEVQLATLMQRAGKLVSGLEELIDKYVPENEQEPYRALLEKPTIDQFSDWHNCEKLVQHALNGNMEDVEFYAKRVKEQIPQWIEYRKKMSDASTERMVKARTARSKRVS